MSISLSLLLVLGSIGTTLGTHFCGGHAVISELMLGQKHLDCGMGMMEMPEKSGDQQVSAPDCCENQYVTVENDDYEVVIEAPTFLITIQSPTFLYQVELNQESPVFSFRDLSPPLPDEPLNVLHQVFII